MRMAKKMRPPTLAAAMIIIIVVFQLSPANSNSFQFDIWTI